MENDDYNIWVEEHIGEKTLADAYRLAVKWIRRLAVKWIRYAGQLKLKYIAYAIKYIGYAIVAISLLFGIWSVAHYHYNLNSWVSLPPVLPFYGIWCGFAHIFEMMTGTGDSYHYTFFDGDLWATIIISAIISFGTPNNNTKGLFYFIFLMTVVEYWDYSFLETDGTDPILGSACFWLFFVMIPVLLIIKNNTDSPNKNNIMQNIYFTSDTHFLHSNIVKYCPNRQFGDGIKHDEYLVEIWNRRIMKKDTVYIVGDLAFGSKKTATELLAKLHGQKHLILGNHDASCSKLPNYFVSIHQIRDLHFRKEAYPFLETDFYLTLCHYPLLEWNKKHYGACMAHGHCHGKLDDFNLQSNDLRVDVGIDGKLAQCCGGIISLGEIYEYFCVKIKGMNYKYDSI
jgi:calcineurin-like phosphoesterase family protein